VPQLHSSEATPHPLVIGLTNAARRLAGARAGESRHWYRSPVIREESPADLAEIRALVQAVFGGLSEAELVDALRQAGKLICSAVAVTKVRLWRMPRLAL
jgi:hypothetical protein